MRCPDCGAPTEVYRIVKPESVNASYRTRHCTRCRARFLTTEVVSRRISDARSLDRLAREEETLRVALSSAKHNEEDSPTTQVVED
jgi:transcriptional regulator NrdR family protein